MKLVFLGSGSAFTVGEGNYQSNILLRSASGRNLLIDCGTDIRFALHDAGMDFRDVHDVYVSHLHGDHVGGLEWLAFTKKFEEGGCRPRLYICEDLVDTLWNNVLRGGLTSLRETVAALSCYFQVIPLVPNDHFQWEKADFRLIKTIHFYSGESILPCYGLMITFKGKSVFITTDTQYTPEHFMPEYLKADLIFQDCETSQNKSGIHAHYTELVNLDSKIKKKMWLYHYQPGTLPSAIENGFKGFVAKGQEFDLEKI